MKTAQVVNPFLDKYLAFNGDDVIDDTDQLPLGESPHSKTSIQVDFNAYNITSGALVSATNIPMTYQANTGFWLIDIAEIPDFSSVDRQKFVAKVSKDSGETIDMRTFKVHEFSIDTDGFEDALMRLGYQIEISEGEAWMRWYDGEVAKWEAPLYKNGTGTDPATELSNISHRGPIVSTALLS